MISKCTFFSLADEVSSQYHRAVWILLSTHVYSTMQPTTGVGAVCWRPTQRTRYVTDEKTFIGSTSRLSGRSRTLIDIESVGFRGYFGRHSPATERTPHVPFRERWIQQASPGGRFADARRPRSSNKGLRERPFRTRENEGVMTEGR